MATSSDIYLSRLQDSEALPGVSDKMLQIREASDRAYANASAASDARKAVVRQNAGSLIGILDLDENSFAGQAVNAGAAVLSGLASNVVGAVAALPANAGAAAEMQGFTQAEVDAYNASKRGVATPEQNALLDRNIQSQGSALDLWRNATVGGDSVRSRITNADNLNQSARGINDFFDIGGIVNRTGQTNLTNQLKDTFQDNWTKVTEGNAADKASGIAGLLGGAISAGIDNKDGLVSYLAENIPQMALGMFGTVGKASQLASNVGYGFDTFQDGVKEYEKANGRMPTGEDLNQILAWSAAAAGAEQAGDLLSIRGFQEMLGKGAAKAASGEAVKQGAAATVGRIAGGTAAGFGSESATEGFQTYAEGQAQFKDVSAEDIYTSAAVGGLIGGAMRGGLSTAAEGARVLYSAQEKGATLIAERQAKKEDLSEAIKNNDASKYSNVKSKEYNPATAVDVLFQAAQANKDDAALQTKNLEEANAVLTTATERAEALTQRVEAAKNPEATRTALEAEVAQRTQELEQATPDDQEIAQLRLEVAQDNLDQLNDDVKRVKALDSQLKTLNSSIEKGNKIVSAFTTTESADLTTEQISNPSTPQEAEKVINLSMTAPGKVNTAALNQLAGNTNLTPEQKAYVEAAKAAREAEATATSIDTVNTDVLYGNTKTNKVGVQQYRYRITKAIAGGQMNVARGALRMMESFAANHESKAALAQEVLDERIAEGSNDNVTIAPDSKGVWQRLDAPVSREEAKRKGYMNIHRGSNRTGLIDAVRMEADAVNAALAEMEAAVAMKAKPAKAPAQKSAQSTSAPAKAEVQSTLSSDKGKDGGVADQAQVATPSSEVQETSQTVAPEKQIKEETEGGLTVFANAKQANVNMEADYKNLNLVSQYFTQRSIKSNDASAQPLVAVKDFISALKNKSVKVSDFVADGSLNEKQQAAVRHFYRFATTNAGLITQNLQLGRDVFGYQDMVQFLVQDGNVDENVTTAIAAAAYTWIAENGSKPNYNTDEDIQDMLGMSEFDYVSYELRALLSKAGSNERNIIASMGQKAVAALGLKADKNAPANLQATLEISIGAQAWKLLDDLGFLKRTIVSGKTIQNAVSASKAKNYDANASFNFSAVVRDENGVIPAVKEIIEAQKGTSSILNKLFGVESTLVAPTTKPVRKVQKTTQGTDQPVPTKMQEVIKYENSVPNYLRQDTWGLLTAMDGEAIRDIAGYNRVDLNTLHAVQRDGVQAKNDGLDNQIANAVEFFGEHDPDAPMYFEHSVWKQQRVGISTNMINPQTSKFHRFLVSRPEWETKVNLNDVAMVESLTLRIGEGLKIKTDKQGNAKSLAAIEAKIADPVIQAAAEAIQATMIEGGEMTPVRQKAIVDGVKAGKMQLHSLDALIALASLQNAQAKGLDSVTVKLMGEIDGVTNGPMLSHLLMGAAPNPTALYDMLNRGGFYSASQEDSNYNVWRGKEGNQDLYETTISHVLDRMDVPKDIRDAFYQMVGVLSDEQTSKITGEGRDIIKTPLTAMVFGSSLEGAIDSMFEKFLGTVYEKMADSANDASVRDANMAAINRLLSNGRSQELFTRKTDLLEAKLTNSQKIALRYSFDEIIGNAVIETMQVDFAMFMEARKTVNDAAQASFKLYDAARKGITEKFIADKMAAGEIAYRETKEGKQPIHDLTPSMKEELGALLLPVTPVQATLMALDSDQPDAGMQVAKVNRQFSRQPQYQGEAHFGTKTSTGTKSLKLAAYEFSVASPGVAMMVMSVHSTDSAISHNAVMGFGEPTQVLNVHDAHGSGLQHFERTARNLNRATWDAMLRYSPATQMSKTLQRTVEGMSALLANPEYAAAVKPYLKDALTLGTKKSPVTLAELVSNMAATAAAADTVKFATLAQMKVVDQYALEGGQYTVTDADTQAAEKALAEVKIDIPANVEAAIKDIETASRTKSASKKVEADAEYQNELQPSPAAAIAKRVTPATAGSLASVVSEASAIRENLDAGMPVQEAVEALPAVEQAKVVQALGEAQNKQSKSVFSPWGDMGESNVDHDLQLVAALEATPVMGKEQVLDVLREALGRSVAPRNIKEFNVKLYQMLKKTIPENLEVKYVTPTTSSNEVMGKGASKSRGWYMSQGGSNQVYILSTDHKYSGVTTELLLHELTHSVLAGVVESELDKKAKDSSYTSDALQMIESLEDLRRTAAQYLQSSGLSHLSPAVANVHEFISWGMTNLPFQTDVLAKIEGKSAVGKLIQGMKAFIQNLVGILFRNTSRSEQAVAVNGLTVMVTNTAGLFAEAAAKKSSTDILLNQQATDPLTKVENMTPEQLFEAIADPNPNNQPSQEFGAQLVDLLNNLVSKIHVPLGVIKEVARANQALGAMDVYTKALNDGKLPFASLALNSGFKVNDQEAFVMEQVEATMRAALNSNDTQTTAAYSELRRVFEKAAKTIKVADLLPEGVTEATATPSDMAEAKALWDAAFNSEADAGSKSNYMGKFVALALAHEGFASVLGFDARRTVRDPDNIWDQLMGWVDKALNVLLGKLTKTSGLVSADDFVKQLAEDLVAIEDKRRTRVANQFDTLMSGVEDKMTKLGDAGQKKLLDVANSQFFKKSQNGFVKAAGLGISLVAAPERVHGILDGINAVRDKYFTERQGVFSSMITEMRGLDGAKDAFLKLLLGTKNIERERANLTSEVGKAISDSFAKKEFSKLEQRAITQVFLRNDLAALVDGFSMQEIHKLLTDGSYLKAEIAKKVAAVQVTPYANNMLNQAAALGYFLATGESKHPNLMLNAHNIANMGGNKNIGKVNDDVAVQLESDLDVLVSLYAIQYSGKTTNSTAAAIFKDELDRTDGGNGVETIIKLHKELQRDSKERLFDMNDALVMKGYLPEVTNPYISFKVADELEGKELLRMGYVKGKQVGNDPTEANPEVKHIYTQRDGGMQRYLSSIMSYTGNQRKGSSNQKDNTFEVDQIFNRKSAYVDRMDQGLVDPLTVNDTYMVPVMNNMGQVVNYRYMMANHTRDNLLERDNRFEHLLGTMAGNTFDKVASPEQNRVTVEALHSLYQDELGTDAARYQEISATSQDPEFREIWRMLPDQTKKDIEAIWGTKAMWVRNDMLDLVFGYRKSSLATLWDKDHRAFYENALVWTVESVLRAWAVTKGEDPEVWAARAQKYVRNGEDMWQSIVAETKDIIVVRTGTVLFGNIMSNFSVLGWYGVPVKDMIRHHRVALKAAQDYQRDSARQTRVEMMLATGALEGNDQATLRAELVRLNDALERNPVKELIDVGLMPTIVEDLSASEDIYSYKSQLARKVGSLTAGLNPTIKKGAEYVYMGQKTPLYQGLNRATQLSDFVARYTLYHHLTGKMGMDKGEAVTRASDAFVNYDIPTHRSVQYLNDMGVLMFTKYYLRIQRVLLQLFREKPVRGLVMGLMGHFINGMETIHDSAMWGRIGNNPFSTGALRYPGSLTDLVTIKAAISLK